MLSAADFNRAGDSFRLRRVSAPGCLLSPPADDELVCCDIDVRGGRITAVLPHDGATAATELPVLNGDDALVWPGLVDMHTHLDKGHIWPRQPNPDGTFDGALNAVVKDRDRYWSADDVAARMEFSLRCAYAHGTVAVRTHLDSQPPQHDISWPVFAELRERWAGRIALQAVNLVTIDAMQSPFAEQIADHVARYNGVLGAVTFMTPGLDDELELTFKLAAERGLDLDFHVDESLDPAAQSLNHIAATAERLNFGGRIVAGHCCSLSIQADKVIANTLARVKAAGITVVSLPLCNLYLQDRHRGRTPRQRGVTLLHELAAAGVPVAIASDNTRDPFYAYGDLDLLEVFTQSARIAHLDHPFGDWPNLIARTPAAALGLDAGAGLLSTDARADLILCPARNFSEMLSRPQHGRIVLRDGRPIDTTPPDYRELDALFSA